MFIINKIYIIKRFVFILVFIPLIGFSQTIVNGDSLLNYFNGILNEFRASNGVGPIEVDGSLKDFTDNWSKKMSSMGVVSHGSGDNVFQRRAIDYFPPGTFCGENCTQINTPKVNTDINIVSPIKNSEPYVKKAYSGKITQYELAYLAFLNFYNSPPHNAFLLNKDTKYFYISCSRGTDNMTYICYVARS